MTAQEAISSFSKQYGPFAFGVVSLLIIWFAIMAPELDRRQLDFNTLTTIQAQQIEIVSQMKETTSALRDIVIILEDISRNERENQQQQPSGRINSYDHPSLMFVKHRVGLGSSPSIKYRSIRSTKDSRRSPASCAI